MIGISNFVAAMFGGSIVAQKIFVAVRSAALTKSASGLPKLSDFSQKLTKKNK